MSALLGASAIALGYLAGAVPTGLMVGKLRGVDLREAGSKNIGFTNAWRVLGWKEGLAVLAIDVAKAAAATALLPRYLPHPEWTWLPVAVGFAVMLGNMVNVFLRAKGGKGIASGLGVFAVLSPHATALALALFIVAVAATRYVSVGSIIATTALMGGSHAWAPPPVAWMMTVIWAFVLWKHRENIGRLRRGEERKFGAPATAPPAPPA